MLIATIAVGFVLMTLGVAMLLVGEVPFIAGTRIPAVRSRLIGGVLVSFLPLAFGVRAVVSAIFGSDAVEGPVVTSFVFSFCCLATFVILFRVLVPKRAPRQPGERAPAPVGPAKKNPFAEPAPAQDAAVELEFMDDEPAPKPTAKKAKKPAAESNPFDFS